MSKTADTAFFCRECGYESAKWMGQCPACREWNTFEEAPKKKIKNAGGIRTGLSDLRENKPVTMAEITACEDERMLSGTEEFDRVLGGGIIRGSLVLVGGDPGIGKSTLLTQICKNLSDAGYKVLYVTGEESLAQIKLRADRLGSFSDNMKLLCETDLDAVEDAIKEYRPDAAVIDSIQTMYRQEVASAPGSPTQVRECTNILMQLAKGLGTALFIVGHVTKEGTVAGPRMLEHMVDTVLYFEGDAHASYRLLRGVKNRFGATNEIGVFEMCAGGLKEVKNPSEFMLAGRPENAPGSVVSCSIEGTRPILVEIQALIARSALGNPRRSATGIDYNRMNLMLAVLEKRLGFSLSECDAYINIAGGMRINETALDLAVIASLASVYKDFAIRPDVIAIGEVGLAGEVRSVGLTELRVREAKKLGFKTAVVPKTAVPALKGIKGIDIIGVSDVREAVSVLKGQLSL